MKFRRALTFQLVLLGICLASTLCAQNFIGYSRQQVKSMVKDSLPGFFLAKEIQNGVKSFIKYENTFEEQTVLFIFNEKGVCTAVNRMYNFIEKDGLVKELSSKYRKVSKNEWRFKKEGKEYAAVLKEEEWFLKLIIKSRKK